MIRRLPGINQISANGAMGIFKTEAPVMPKEVADFISQVPMDKDIQFYKKEDINNVKIDVETNNLVRENLEKSPCFEVDEMKDITETRAISRISNMKKILSESIDKLLGRNNPKDKGAER